MTKLSFEDLNNKVCAITGGGGVIGKALAIGLGSVGVKTALLDLNKEMADKVAAEVKAETGSISIGVETNVLDKTSLENAKQEVNDKLGKINMLINGAGGNSPKATSASETMTNDLKDDLGKTFYGLDIAGFEFVFNLNFMGTILPTMVLSKDMLDEGGVVLNVSSMSAYRPLTKVPAYSAAKASINSITEWLSVHLAPVGIRVNAIAPGFFLTNQNRFLLTDEKTGELTPRGHKIISNTPMGRFGEVEELQGTVNYLMSDLSKFVTGVVMPVDGGFNAFSGV
ncbi:MAG: SDR family oxidoreductase [Cyclobacteriaceae bacterium]|nr:SDR family oxidoreductase [Cyclobacteriaceae bacterium]